MFRTKKDVDRHVADILSKINNENERNLRGYTFAKLYYVVKDFESAKRYLSGFLSLKEKNPTAHKLMAQIYENTGQLEKAVQSYKKSLELEENQKDVVLKICELYCQLTVDPDRARYWADRAEKLFPHNDIVFRLRECIMSADGNQNSQELEDLISSELASRPRDVKLRIKLLRLYLDTERIHEAYEHAVQVESKKPHFNSLDWYYCLNDVFESYLEDNTQECNKDFYINFLSATDRLVYLILEEKRKKEKFKKNNQTSSIADSATALHSFDQHLFKAMQLNEKHENAWKAFLNHMNGQLYFHFGTLILIRAKKDQANMKEAILMGSTLLLLSYMYKPLDLQSSWFSQASEAMQKEYRHWYEQACFRLSQCGHVVIGLCQEDRVKWLQKLKQQMQSPSGKEKIFQRVFSSREYRESVATSQFMKSSISEFTPEFPDIKALHEYDDVASLLYPNSLHHIVWLALQYYNVKDKVQPDYGFKMFEGLQFSVNNLNTSAPETLCQLDIDSFLYATVRTCALALEERQTIMYTSVDISTHLPVNISDWLCTQEQAQWWSAAYTLFKNIANENFGDLRRILQHGIEVVRVMDCHGMDVNLVIHLAETFADRTSELKNQVDNELDRANEINSLGNRAAHFWKAAVGMLEKLANNQTNRIPKSRLFESYNADPSTEEVKKLLESGHFYLACQSMNAGHHEEAITAFEGLKSAYASFYQAVIYKKLAAEEYNKPRETITSEMRSKHIILLTRARDALYVTLDRIRGDRKHPLNQVLSDEIEDIETKLARIDPDTAQRHEFDGLSDEMLSSQESVEQEDLESPNPHRNPENQHHSHKHQDSRRNRSSHSLLQNIPALSLPFVTPPHCDPSPEHISRHREEHNRPSPERLDAQMRSLAYSHDAVIKTIMEQNKALIETNRSIVEELKQNKIVVEQLKGQLEDIHKQILVSRSRRRKFSKISLMGRHTQPVNGASQVDVEDNPEEEEDYYPGYYYEDDIGYELDEPENAFHDYTYNAAYKYPDAQLQNDYPYGQVTGLHGTSTVTYAPPAGRNIGVPPHHPQSSYAAYYSQSHHTVPTLGTPRGPSILHGHSSHPASALASPQLGPGYFSTPANAISARLPFSEGQKLPEFNFNTAPAVPSPSLPLSVDKNAYSQVGAVGQPQIIMPAAPLEPPGASSSNPMTGSITASSSQTYISPPKHSSPNIHSTLDTNRFRKESEGKERTVSEGDSYQEEEYSGPDFKPIIPLPAEVEIKTGEEEENKLFEERAKLFRFIDKEWKERGTGVVKILHNEATGKVRLLMRRDQILKVCANHYIIPDMKLSPMKNSETAWVWAAQDFADEEVRTEQFCIRFKTVEIAQKFKKEFDNARELVSKANSIARGSTAAEQKPVKVSEGFGDEFKPKPGTWNCPTCLINNQTDKLSCAACETPKPGLKTTEDKTSVASKFVFGGTSSGFNFYTSGSHQSNTSSVSTFIMPSSGTTTTSTSFTGGLPANTTVSSLSTPVFGFPSTTSVSANATTKTFTFGINPPSASRSESVAASTIATVSSPHTIAFGMPSVTPTTAGSKTDRPEPFIFGQTPISQTNNKGSPAFVFGSSGSSPQQSKPSGFVFGASTLPKDSEKSAEEASPGPASVLLSALASKHQEFEASVSSSNQETKTISYGGFTFTGTPNIKVTNDSTTKKEIKTSPLKAKELISKDEVIKSEQSKQSPFASFSFNISKPDSNKSVSSQPFSETSKTAQSNIPSFLQNVSPDLSFQALAKSASETPVLKRDPNFTGFKGVGQRLFEPAGACGDQQETPETPTEFESTAEFKPVIPMPDLIELKTGEEEEDKLFAERAKLFRYDFSVKQWKERGIGEMKILQHRDNKRCRILMRREQVFKICANHYILKDMELKTLLSSDKAWTWFANDFSDGVIKPEHLAVKFKTIDIAKEFQKVFMSCKLAAKKDNESTFTPLKDPEAKVDDRPLSEIFKNEAGSWECKSCLLVNKPAVMKCLACEADRPAKAVADQSVSVGNQSNPVLGISSFKGKKPNEPVEGKFLDSKDTRPLSELFKPEVGSWECSSCYVRNKSDLIACISCCTPKPGSTPNLESKQSNKAAFGSASLPQFQFGKSTSEGNVGFNLKLPSTPGGGFSFKIPVTTTSATSTTTTSSIKSGFLTSDISTVTVGNTPLSSSTEASSNFQIGFQFGQKSFPSPPTGNNSTDENASAVEFRFGSPQKFTFSFSGVRPKSPAKTPKSPHGTADDSGELSEEVEGESDDHIYFQPVVPLPDKVEVKTGEEDENVLYCQRAKLFRLFENEWKERGLGEFKILQHIETKKVRLLMRREQVLKICLNHYLTTDLKFVEKDDRSWLWVATDFADNEPHQESLAIRFKTSEIAKQFIEAINNAKELLKNNSFSSPAIQKTNVDSSVAKTISASNSPSQDITKSASPLNTFSFKLDSSKLPETSPTSAFSFGNKFGSTVGYPKSTSLFGGSSPKEKRSPPEVSSQSSFSDTADVEIVYVKEATPEQKAKAKALLLPSNFYLYEDAPPCPGCRGCENRPILKSFKEDKVDVEIVHEEKANPEQIDKSRMYHLPSNFYLYEKKSPCPGCRGCADDSTHSHDEKDDKPVLEIQPQVEPDSTTPTPDPLPCFGNIAAAVDFASIAKQETSSFLNSSPASNFTFTGFGTKVFHNTSQEESEDGNDSNVSSHDPHFEPVVSLPPRVSTVTGEEDEEKIFCQRAKLYRYDNDVKQWKERGIGEMKILKHKQTGKYRLLLRREQVLKIACNHNISPDLELKPLTSSETAWFWYAMDFADETPQFQKLAVRFKTIELAQEFKKKFEECQQELNNSSVLETSKSDSMTVLDPEEKKENGKASDETKEATSQNPSLTKDTKESKSSENASESVTSSSNEETGSSSVNPSSTFTFKSNENTEDDDNDDNDEDESVMFEKRVSLSYFDKQSDSYQLAGMGNLRILYDDDVYGARIQVTTDEGQLICNHLIAIQTTLEVNKKECHWAALDFSKVPPVRRRFRATFSSPAAAEQFSEMFKEGKECAKAVEILERPYDPTMTMEDLINSTVEALYSKAPDQEGGKSNCLTLPIKLTATGEEIKACSPELAAALKDVIEGDSD